MLSELEKTIVEKVVGAFIAKRRPPPHVREKLDLGFRIYRQSVEIFEIRPDWRGNGQIHKFPVAKATYVKSQHVWKLYWLRQNLKWEGYEPLRKTHTIEGVVAEIDADPHGCFWG